MSYRCSSPSSRLKQPEWRRAPCCGVRHPAVTRALAALEDRAGLRLVERTTQPLAPTEAGLRLADMARRVLADYDDAARGRRGAAARQAARDGAARVRAAPRDAWPSSPSWTSIRTCRSNWCSTTAISI
ncbi:LysR family transcriptional regulator [Massilia sp. B-10]|nr:LysR family transcriptional regulator [Massilia sp. B-10]